MLWGGGGVGGRGWYHFVSQASAMKEHKMAMELQALDEDGRKELARKVSEMQRKHALAVMTLSTQEERLAYVKGIPAEVSIFSVVI